MIGDYFWALGVVYSCVLLELWGARGAQVGVERMLEVRPGPLYFIQRLWELGKD
jgi:hypothetical protein